MACACKKGVGELIKIMKIYLKKKKYIKKKKNIEISSILGLINHIYG